jgi:alpha-tubulin suppressor-like RCC1 family protein
MERQLITAMILFYFYTVTCGFLAVRIAAMKGRRRIWGWLGVLLGLIGVVIVCFLPNAKGVEGQTNPILSFFKRLSGISSAAVWITVVGVLVIVGAAVLITQVNSHREKIANQKALVLEDDKIPEWNAKEIKGKPTAVFCGDGNQFVLTKKGDLYAWGKLDIDPAGKGGVAYKNAKKVCVAGRTIYVLTTEGVLYGKGANHNRLIPAHQQPVAEEFVKIADGVKDISLSLSIGAYIKNDGKLYVCGINSYGQLGAEITHTEGTARMLAEKVVQVVATDRSLYYRTENGAVFALGSNAYGQFGLGNQEPQATPVKIGEGCKDFAAGDDFTLLLKTDGKVLSAGNNSFGQLGRVTLEDQREAEEKAKEEMAKGGEEQPKAKKQEKPAPSQSVFAEVKFSKTPTKLAASDHSAYALVGDQLYGWGNNQFGQVGEGELRIRKPQVVCKEIVQFSAAGKNLLILNKKGKVLGIGDTRYQQLGAAEGKSLAEIAKVKGA